MFQTTTPSVLVRKDSPGYQVKTDCFPFFWSECRQPADRRGRREWTQGPGAGTVIYFICTDICEALLSGISPSLCARSSSALSQAPCTPLLCLPSVNIQANRMSYEEECPWKQ